MKEYNDDDLSNKSDEELKNETYKILEEDVFTEIENVEVVKDYNNYKSNNVLNDYKNSYKESNSSYGEERQKREVKILAKVFSIILIAAVLFIVSVVIFIKNAYENMEEMIDEQYYDIEYDLDNDGYLDYDELNTYEEENATDYEKYYKAIELFVDKEEKVIYFELENRNSYKVDFAYIKIAFYDENKNLIDVCEESISNVSIDGKVIERVHYNKEFASYDVIVTVDDYYTEIEEVESADVSLISSHENFESGDIEYTIKNNSEKSVSGDVYVIFYDEADNIVDIEYDFVYDLGAGKTVTELMYLYNDKDYSYFKVDLSGLTIDNY